MAAEFTPVLLPEFCQPDETMLLGKKLVQIVKKLKIALPSITGKPINALPTDTRYRNYGAHSREDLRRTFRAH